MTNLVVHNLNKRFGGLHVLKDVNFKIEGPELASGEKVTVTAVDGVILKVESQRSAAETPEDGSP